MAALSQVQWEKIFGTFSYKEGKSGRVIPDKAWVAANIVRLRVPYGNDSDPLIAMLYCHRKVALSIEAAFDELEQAGLLYLVRSVDGCYVPRHILWKPAKPLSRHSWGGALDLNAKYFPYGSQKQQDARLVAALARHGFACGHKDGGLWKTTYDPMHFEWTYVPPNKEQP